jgi:hypothetical protein
MSLIKGLGEQDPENVDMVRWFNVNYCRKYLLFTYQVWVERIPHTHSAIVNNVRVCCFYLVHNIRHDRPPHIRRIIRLSLDI